MTTDTSPLAQIAQDAIDAAIWRLVGVLRLSFREAARQLAVGVEVHGETVRAEMTHQSVWQRYTRLRKAAVPAEEVDAHRLEALVSLHEGERVAAGIMLDPGVDPATRLRAVLTVDRLVRTRAGLLGLELSGGVTVNVTVEDRQERVLGLISEYAPELLEGTAREG